MNAVHSIFAVLPPPPDDASNWYGTLELTIAGLSALCALIMVWNNFCMNRRMGISWTADQINSCLIPFTMAFIFIVIYFVSRYGS